MARGSPQFSEQRTIHPISFTQVRRKTFHQLVRGHLRLHPDGRLAVAVPGYRELRFAAGFLVFRLTASRYLPAGRSVQVIREGSILRLTTGLQRSERGSMVNKIHTRVRVNEYPIRVNKLFSMINELCFHNKRHKFYDSDSASASTSFPCSTHHLSASAFASYPKNREFFSFSARTP